MSDPTVGTTSTYVYGISGNYVVGYFVAASATAQGFYYNLSTQTYTTLNDPSGVNGTLLTGIDGTTVVGEYEDSNFLSNGFTTNIVPEPATGSLGVLGALGLLASRRHRARLAGVRWTT